MSKALIQSGTTKCPFCNGSMFDMEEQWKQMDIAVEQTEMPENYKD